MNFLLATLFSLGTLTNTVPLLNNQENSINKKEIDQKEDISKFKLKPNSISIKNDEKNIRNYVYLQLIKQYPEDIAFLSDVWLNKNNYIIEGEDFTILKNSIGNKYEILIFALPTNSLFKGFTWFNVWLVPFEQGIDLSEFDKFFDPNNSKNQTTIMMKKKWNSWIIKFK
ncbi:hypothetical protein [Spiroplasma taiwanense]|uniref:Uncharacterized protein n=1 Tax=Spiroplasma taiwanense CT-1 TaxID=1276220 RepID=S5MHF7_9MOLU|nr:hypothetical protein [Spiroplasma taiwanense]AGR41275.1 hypothetical protein STAIW_v1c06570 [Spiroplasma taiwanense CT-1]